jgi:hypothetical protein
MAELSPTLVAELDRLSPVETTAPDWLDVRRRARPAGRTRALLVAAALVAVAVPSVALSSGVRSLLGLGPQPVAAKSRLLVSAPIGNGYWVHYLQGPSNARGWCTYSIVDHSSQLDRSETMNGGGGCSPRGTRLQWVATRKRPLIAAVDVARGIPPYVTGMVARPLHVHRVALVWPGGSHDLMLRLWHFAGGTPAVAGSRSVELVAYDAQGKVVASKKLTLR